MNSKQTREKLEKGTIEMDEALSTQKTAETAAPEVQETESDTEDMNFFKRLGAAHRVLWNKPKKKTKKPEDEKQPSIAKKIVVAAVLGTLVTAGGAAAVLTSNNKKKKTQGNDRPERLEDTVVADVEAEEIEEATETED